MILTTEFYNHRLEPIPNYDRIIWDNAFSHQARESQLITFLQKINLPKKVCLIVNHNFNYEQINESDIELILLNLSDHPGGNYAYNLFTKPLKLLTSDYNRSDYHAFHLLFSAYFAQYDTIDFDNQKQYTVSLINRSPRLTRLYFLNKIRQNPVLENMYIKWFKMSESNGPVPAHESIVEVLGQETEDFLRYEKNYPNFKATPESELCIDIEDFRNSYLNLVVESRLEDIGYLTEKVYKPLRTGQLFLIQGPPGTVRYLRSVGFDTYDDFIDHSYDTITDWQQRSDAVLSELDRIYAGIEDFYFASKSRRMYNRNHLLSDQLIHQVLSNLS